MRLRKVNLHRFRQFIDAEITLDSRVTVIVGKNDTGKTNFLSQFFDQCLYHEVIAGHDRPKLKGFENDRMSFSLVWEIEDTDYTHFPLEKAFGSTQAEVLEIIFEDHDDSTKENWMYVVDGKPIAAETQRKDLLHPYVLLPTPYYLRIGEKRQILSTFEFSLYDLPENSQSIQPLARRIPIEELFLQLSGLTANTRKVSDRGIDEPWQTVRPRPSIEVSEINERLATLSQRITDKLAEWWKDPPDLRFSARLPGDSTFSHEINSYIVELIVRDSLGQRLWGEGLTWFITFLIEMLNIEDQSRPQLILCDEPASPLHPGMQRVVTKILDQLSTDHQVIYSTHSPFMMDWNYPQRLRLFDRDHTSGRGFINNKPFHPRSAERVWDPLRAAIGVTVGDIAVIGETNLLVEGITDQILLANVSQLLRSEKKDHLDLSKVSIIPFSEHPILEQLLVTSKAHNSKAVVLTDADEGGRTVQKVCKRRNVPYISLDEYAPDGRSDVSIEDLIGLEEYVTFVNLVYKDFPWFKELDPGVLRENIGLESLGFYLATLFKDQFEQSFSKICVTVFIVNDIASLSKPAKERFQKVFKSVSQHLNQR